MYVLIKTFQFPTAEKRLVCLAVWRCAVIEIKRRKVLRLIDLCLNETWKDVALQLSGSVQSRMNLNKTVTVLHCFQRSAVIYH
jgi:hypothetical protein